MIVIAAVLLAASMINGPERKFLLAEDKALGETRFAFAVKSIASFAFPDFRVSALTILCKNPSLQLALIYSAGLFC